MRVGLVGWRGMVGSVLMDRMRTMGDFDKIEAVFFTTSQAGQDAPAESAEPKLKDANDIAELAKMDVVLTCQGGDTPKPCTVLCVPVAGVGSGLMRPVRCA